jgi:Ni,Fe-hydrogenase I cytochrome b subunit
MVKIKMSHVLRILLVLIALISDGYTVYNIIHIGKPFEEPTNFPEGVRNFIQMITFFITILIILLTIPGIIMKIYKLEFTINTNKLKQILNKLK